MHRHVVSATEAQLPNSLSNILLVWLRYALMESGNDCKTMIRCRVIRPFPTETQDSQSGPGMKPQTIPTQHPDRSLNPLGERVVPATERPRVDSILRRPQDLENEIPLYDASRLPPCKRKCVDSANASLLRPILVTQSVAYVTTVRLPWLRYPGISVVLNYAG